jgi:hypothetical protein
MNPVEIPYGNHTFPVKGKIPYGNYFHPFASLYKTRCRIYIINHSINSNKKHLQGEQGKPSRQGEAISLRKTPPFCDGKTPLCR